MALKLLMKPSTLWSLVSCCKIIKPGDLGPEKEVGSTFAPLDTLTINLLTSNPAGHFLLNSLECVAIVSSARAESVSIKATADAFGSLVVPDDGLKAKDLMGIRI